MAATAIAFADLRDIMTARTQCPGIRSDRDLCAEGAASQSNVVSCLGIAIVGDEFVVAVDAGIGKVKADNAALVFRSLFDKLDGFPVLFEHRFEFGLDLVAFYNFVQ